MLLLSLLRLTSIFGSGVARDWGGVLTGLCHSFAAEALTAQAPVLHRAAAMRSPACAAQRGSAMGYASSVPW